MEWMKLQLNRKRRMAVVLVALVVAGGVGFWYWGNQAAAAPFMTGRVERGSLRNTVTATGTLQAVTTVQVGSQASGTISALLVDFNSTVKKGQIIAQLDPAVSQAQVQQARANLGQAQAGLEQARAGEAQARVVQAEAQVQNAQAQVQQAQAALQLSELNASHTTIRSPIDGVVVSRNVDVGQTVAAS